MSTSRRRVLRAVTGLTVRRLRARGVRHLRRQQPPASSSGTKLPEDARLLAAVAAAPGPEGPRRRREGLRRSRKGWKAIVQDPNFDPAKQNQQLNEVLSSGRPAPSG